MTFVAAPPAPVASVADTIEGDGWWPDLSIAKFRDAIRVGTQVSDGRIRDALVSAAIAADGQLAKWRAAQGDISSLADVPGMSIGGEPRPVILWRRIVYAHAAADLAETHNDITATDAGRSAREVRAVSAEDHRRNAIVAVRDLLGRSRSRAALL